MAEKHLLVLDEKHLESARAQHVDVWEPEDEYPAPAHSSQSFQHVLIFALFCSNVFFAALAVFFYNNGHCPVVPLSQRIDPFAISATPRDARSSIGSEQRSFTGALKYNATAGSVYRAAAAAAVTNASEPQFVGDPRTTAGIDRAWKDLLHGSKFALSAEEAAHLVQDGPAKGTSRLGRVYAELDVFHSLSCLNALRLALDNDFYGEHGAQDGLGWQKTTRSDRVQLDYCIDHLRQSLQCSADLSVVPMLARSSTGVELSSQPRTCRRWSDVRSWLDRRQERSRFMEQQHQGMAQ